MEAVRPVVLFYCVNYCSKMQNYRDLATSVWAAITWRVTHIELCDMQKQKL